MKLLRTTYRLLLIVPALLLFAGIAGAEHDMTGELGVDLDSYGFSNALRDTTRAYKTTRTLSNHFLNLNLNGPLINSHFASYSLRSRIFGTYYRAINDNQSKSLYFNPDLNGYYAQITMFPSRPYPLQLFHGKSRDYSVRYEPTNRGEIELVQPGLAVVRRYQSDKLTTGSLARMSVSENTNVLASYKQDRTKTFRNYDFGENRDIWVNMVGGRYNPLNEQDTIRIINEIPDAAVNIYITGIPGTITLDPMGDTSVAVDTGWQEVQVIPLRFYNQYRFRIYIRTAMIWRIVYTEPATPKDIDQTLTSASVGMNMTRDEKFYDELYYEYSDQWESVQRLTSFMNNFSNNARWNLTKNSDLTFLTTFIRNQTTVDTISYQLTRSFLHMTTYNYKRRRGLGLMFSHSYNNNLSNTGVDEVIGNINTFTNKVTIPSRTLDYRLDVKSNVSLLSDNKGYVYNQYATTITNRIRFDFVGLELEPKNEFKYAINHQENPFIDSREIENRLFLIGERTRTRLLGDIRFAGEYNYRKKSGGTSADIKNRFRFDLTVIKKFGRGNRLMFMTIHEHEAYSRTMSGPGAEQQSVARPSVAKASYKVDLTLTPMTDVLFGGNLMVITQNGNTIWKYGLMVNAVLPVIHIPVKSFLLAETRKLVGLDPQTYLSVNTKVSYQFRQITLLLTHIYAKEDVITNRYSYYQINAEISRHFGIF
jgi:hypothetical protein